MIAFQTSQLEVGEVWQDEDPKARIKGAFPLNGVLGTESTGLVYFEVEPGNSLGLHTDDPDELVVVLGGTALATVGDETGELAAGSVAFIPALVPHGFKNIGTDTLRVVGVFPSSDVVSTFEYAMQPFGTRVVTFKGLIPAEV